MANKYIDLNSIDRDLYALVSMIEYFGNVEGEDLEEDEYRILENIKKKSEKIAEWSGSLMRKMNEAGVKRFAEQGGTVIRRDSSKGR